MVSTCESLRFPACDISYLLTRSWEFFTTLDYEWMVFRGHIRYRWTIWVRDDHQFAVISSYTYDRFVFSILGLLYLTRGRSNGRHTYLRWLECYNPDQLSGWYRTLRSRTPGFHHPYLQDLVFFRSREHCPIVF